VKKSTDSRYIKIILLLLFVVPAKAQSLNQNREETCHGPVFSARELSRRATITSRQIPAMTKEALAHNVHGRVVLEAADGPSIHPDNAAVYTRNRRRQARGDSAVGKLSHEEMPQICHK
jgi:hypothetical protein